MVYFMSFFGTTNYFFEASQGKIDGVEMRSLIGKIPSTVGGGTFEDLWSEGGIASLPTAAETWEIVSDNANDTAAGAGARTVLVSYLDDNLQSQSIIATMSGTTPVTLNSDHFRVENSNGLSGGRCVVLTAGASGANEGKITVRVSGGGATRTTILPGISISENGQYTVPAGKTVYATQNLLWFPKNYDGQFQAVLKSNTPDAAKISSGAIPFYQNALTQTFTNNFPAAAGTDISYQVQTASPGASPVWIIEFALVDI